MRAIRDDEMEALRAASMQYHDCARQYVQYLSRRGMFEEVD